VNIWAVGDAGLVLHFDGIDWASIDIGAEQSLFGLVGAGDSEV